MMIQKKHSEQHLIGDCSLQAAAFIGANKIKVIFRPSVSLPLVHTMFSWVKLVASWAPMWCSVFSLMYMYLSQIHKSA